MSKQPKRWYQCPGCWSVLQTVNHYADDDGWIECDCGQAMTCIDLRGESARALKGGTDG